MSPGGAIVVPVISHLMQAYRQEGFQTDPMGIIRKLACEGFSRWWLERLRALGRIVRFCLYKRLP